MKTTRCPRCNRDTYAVAGRFGIHTITDSRLSDHCPMSQQRKPAEGITPRSYEARAVLVADLAEQVQDADPALVWDYLTGLPGGELQRLMMVALAGIPVDRTVDDIFAWVHQLPVAQGANA